jgi:hypothetical protein
LKDMLPKYCFLNNQYRGAPSSILDSDKIDNGIKNFCDSLNRIPDIKTFASCDGHRGKRSMYVLYTANTIHSAEIVSYYLTRIVEKYFKMFEIDSSAVSASHQVFYMPDGIPTGIYFCFAIRYLEKESDKVYNFSEAAAKEIIRQISNKNFGVKMSSGYYKFEDI